jgi:hypothetical protein
MIVFGEKLESSKILQLLESAIPYYLDAWQPLEGEMGLFGKVDPQVFNMRKVGSSSPVIEYVIRPHLNICTIIAALLNKNHFSAEMGLSRERAMVMLNQGVRWAVETHLVGNVDVPDFLERKRWGENWRSSMWASMLGIIAFFGREWLEPGLRKKIQVVLAFEADRFIGVLPPDGCEIDTKLEENALDTMVIAWAINMVPDHPHRSQWEQALSRWAVNIASNSADHADHTQYCNKSVAAWVTTRTLHPDMTAENHGFFHPEILTYGAWVVLAMAAYALHGNATPACLHRKNHQETFDVLLRFCLPTGMIYAPGGNDLPMFMPRPFGLAWGLWNNDPRAQRMTARLLSWMDIIQAQRQAGSVPWIFGFEPHHEGWELLFQSHVGFELAMLAVLPFPEEARFYSSGQIESAVDTRHIYPYVQVCYRRNTRTTRSVAWKALGKHPVIGLNIHSYPELMAPAKAAFLGIPQVGSTIKYWEVAFHHDTFQRDGFDTFGRIHYYGTQKQKILRRDIRIQTWGDDGLIVFDSIFAERDLYFDEQYLSPIYLVNDLWTGSKLNLTSGSLRERIDYDKSNSRILSCPAFWASIESTLLFQFIWGRTKGLMFVPGNERNAPRYWKNCRFDMLAVHFEGNAFAEGDVVYEVGYFVGAGKSPRPFKCAGTSSEFFRGLVILDGKNTIGLM